MRVAKDLYFYLAVACSLGGFYEIRHLPYGWDTVTMFWVGQFFGSGVLVRWIAGGVYSDVIKARMEVAANAPVSEERAKSNEQAKELAKGWDGFRPLNRSLIPAMVTNQQTVEMPKLSYQTHFWTCVLRAYDMDPKGQSKVDLSETTWVTTRRMFSQKPFAEMKRRAAAAGALRRKDGRRNSQFVVADRGRVEWLAAGNTLPDTSPPPSF